MKTIGAFVGGIAFSVCVFIGGAIMYATYRETVDRANVAIEAAHSYANDARDLLTKAQKAADEAGLKASYANTSAEECRSFADMAKKQVAAAVDEEVARRMQDLRVDTRSGKIFDPKLGPNGGIAQ